MTAKEFSDKFDTLLNSYKTSVPYGYEQGNFDFTINEYEKSIYLTQAQEALVRGYFTNATDIDATFEGSENARKSIEALVYTAELEPWETVRLHITKDSTFFRLDKDNEDNDRNLNIWFVIYESLKYVTSKDGDNKSPTACIYDTLVDEDNNKVEYSYTNVVPITHDDFYRTYNNPFRGATNKRALRLTAGNNLYEVISKYPIDKYFIRYVKRPEPIILETLPDDLTIYGKNSTYTVDGVEICCELDESLHDIILSNAVQLALQYHTLTTGKVPVPQQTSSKKDDNND